MLGSREAPPGSRAAPFRVPDPSPAIQSVRSRSTGGEPHMPEPRPPAPSAGDYGDAFPSARKVYVDGHHGLRVPMRESALPGGEPPLRVYDTSGPLGGDVRLGVPEGRGAWIRGR